MMNNTTVYVVLRTLSIDNGVRLVDALPIVEGVFTSYDAANDFVDPLLDDKSEFIQYSIIERQLQ